MVKTVMVIGTTIMMVTMKIMTKTVRTTMKKRKKKIMKIDSTGKQKTRRIGKMKMRMAITTSMRMRNMKHMVIMIKINLPQRKRTI